jgi:hypothetical protein
VKAKLRNESLVLTSNMLRFLTLRLQDIDSHLIINIVNLVVLPDNKVRFWRRVVAFRGIGSITFFLSSLGYGVLLMLPYFDSTHRCGNYFEHFPKNQPVRDFAEKPTG